MTVEDILRKYSGETLGIEFRNGLTVHARIQSVFPEQGDALFVKCGETAVKAPDGTSLASLESFTFVPCGIVRITGLWSRSDSPRKEDRKLVAVRRDEKVMTGLREEIAEKDRTIEDLREEIEGKDRTIGDLRKQIEERNRTIKEREERSRSEKKVTSGPAERKEGMHVRRHPSDESLIEMGKWSKEGGMKIITSVRADEAHRVLGDDAIRGLSDVKNGEWIQARVKGKRQATA